MKSSIIWFLSDRNTNRQCLHVTDFSSEGLKVLDHQIPKHGQSMICSLIRKGTFPGTESLLERNSSTALDILQARAKIES